MSGMNGQNGKPKGPGGRPTKYKPEYAHQAQQHCMLGSDNERLAKLFGVCDATIYNWMREHPEFLEAIKKGREDADNAVAISLFKRATGYSHPEEKIFQHNGEIIKTQTRKHYPPDTAAAFIWLKNRCPELWKDRKDNEIASEDNTIQLPRMKHAENLNGSTNGRI